MSPHRVLACLLAVAAGCADTAEPPTVTRLRAEAAGASCAGGGRAVESGVDRDRDGALGDGEVERTEYLCAPAPAAVLVRVDDVAPDATCADGGIALVGGADDDGDGELDDAEIDQRAVVCHGATATAIARTSDAAPDADCHLGGTTIAGGFDRDGDGELTALEVQRSVRLCTLAAANVLSRRDHEPAGRNCADGGAAVRAGLDDDLDGALDDAEIDTTTYVCAIHEIEAGDVRIDDTTTPEQLARYARLRVIEGALTIHGQASRVDLSALEGVLGGVVISDGVAEVHMPRLRAVAGPFTVYGDRIAALALPALTTIGGEIRVHSTSLVSLALPALTAIESMRIYAEESEELSLESLDLRAVRDIGTFSVTVPSLLRLTFGSLQTARELRLHSLGRVRSIDLSTLTTVRDLTLAGTGINVLDLSFLSTAREISLTGNNAMTVATIDNVSSLAKLFVFGNARLASLVMRDLRFCDYVVLSHSPELSSFASSLSWSNDGIVIHQTGFTDLQPFAALQSAGKVDVKANARMRTTAGLLALQSLGDLFVQDNPALTAIGDLPQLDAIDGNVAVTGNAVLTTLVGLRPVSRLRGSVTVENNLRLRTLGTLDQATFIGGNLRIDNNASLESLTGLSALRLVAGSVTITANTRLPAPERTRFLAQIGR
jgi:hypothetical protein